MSGGEGGKTPDANPLDSSHEGVDRPPSSLWRMNSRDRPDTNAQKPDSFLEGGTRQPPSSYRLAADDKLQGRETNARESRVQVPQDMAQYRDVETLMLVLEDASLEEIRGGAPPSGVACVAAMNHLKRLWESKRKKSGAEQTKLEARYRRYSVDVLYWYKSTNTDASAAACSSTSSTAPRGTCSRYSDYSL